MKTGLYKYFLYLSILGIIVLYSCDLYKTRSVTTIGELTIGADENEYPVLKKEVDEFMRLNKDSRIALKVKTTDELFADLMNGDIKTILVDRDFTKDERDYLAKYKIEVKENKFAKNGIGVIVNPSNPVTKLNFNELRKIYSGEIDDWKNLEGDNKDVYRGKIKPFIARKNSVLHDYFKERIMIGKEYYKPDVVCSTSTQMLDEIKKDKYGIGFISMSWITKFADTLDTVVKPLRIAQVDSNGVIGDYVGLHQGYIANGTYPLIFDAYEISRDFEMNVSVGFISFLLAYDGQKIVLNSGLVPVTQPVRIIQLE